jgi:hypothetical protein
MAERGVHHGNINVISVDLHEPHAKRRALAKKTETRRGALHDHFKPSA